MAFVHSCGVASGLSSIVSLYISLHRVSHDQECTVKGVAFRLRLQDVKVCIVQIQQAGSQVMDVLVLNWYTVYR